MSNSNSHSNRQEETPQHGRTPIQGTILEVDSLGHSGSLQGSDNHTYLFETTSGLKVKEGDIVEALAPTHENNANINGQVHSNKNHGGPKALVVKVGSASPHKPI